jgi:5-(carboxyamino)imidazole ribonucleotide mutase
MVKVGVIMGSKSDYEVMKGACEMLDFFGVEYEKKIVSAHRTPEYMVEYAKSAKSRGIKVIIAGAGGAAHLPGMTAAMTILPVVAVPVKSSNLSGWDSLLSIAQMPAGIPVGTMAINGSKNAALYTVSILALSDEELSKKLEDFRNKQTKDVLESVL